MKIGPFTFTRESAIWWVGLVAAIITGLATLDADTAVNTFGIPALWLPKLRLGALLIGIGSAWAKTSPFPSRKDDSGSVDVRRIAPLVLLALALGASSCASLSGTRHRATVSVVSAHAVLSAIQDTEMTLVCGKSTAPAPPACVPVDRHREVSAKLATAFEYDGKVLQLVRAVPAGGAAPGVAELLGEIRAIVDAVLALIPDSAPRRALVVNIGGL